MRPPGAVSEWFRSGYHARMDEAKSRSPTGSKLFRSSPEFASEAVVDIWAFLSDPQNRDVLGWLGGGLVVVAGGAWAVIKFFASSGAPAKANAAPPAHRMTSRDGVAAGGNVSITHEAWADRLAARAAGSGGRRGRADRGELCRQPRDGDQRQRRGRRRV